MGIEDGKKKFEVITRFIERKDEPSILACLERLRSQAEVIDQGENAEIWALEGHELSDLCVKKLKKTPKLSYRSLEDEFKYQKDVNAIGVRTPLDFMIVKDTETQEEYLIMERIYGVSIAQVMGEFSRKPIPLSFEYDTFFAKLASDIKKLHENNIHHRDLHPGNVMIEEKTGNPVIVDWGTATIAFEGDEHEMYAEKIPMYNEKTMRYEMTSGYFKRDDGSFHNLKSKLSSFKHFRKEAA